MLNRAASGEVHLAGSGISRQEKEGGAANSPVRQKESHHRLTNKRNGSWSAGNLRRRVCQSNA